MRSTKQRSAILDAFERTARPLSPMEILAEAQSALPRLGLATVYREIARLVEAGQLIAVPIGTDAMRYELARPHHHHFKCNDCGQVFDLEGCVGNGLNRLLPPGFRQDAHEIVLYGSCGGCAA